jgi:hypothetical protein
VNSFTTPIPEDYKDQGLQTNGILKINSEEEALVWLWTRPKLFPWPRPVEWVLSPVTGNREWPGDLWGIDSDGELIIIENKLSKLGSRLVRSSRTYDPFVDFDKHWEKYKKECSAASILKKWEILLKEERKEPSRLIEVVRPKKGVLPHSRKCSRLQRWPILTEEIERRVRAGKYEKTVRIYLEERLKHQSCPHYCGLVVKTKEEKNVQSLDYCSGSIEKLQKQVGADHVHLFEACARATADGALKISVGTVQIGVNALSATHHG